MNQIPHSKNVVTAHIDAEGNVIVGDGNTIINLKEAAQYKAIEAEIQELDERFDWAKQKSIQYPDDPDFAVELINIDSKRSERQKDLETLKQEVIRLAEDFARIPINTERLKKAKVHFESGAFVEARAVLDAEVMGQELDALLEQKETLSIKTQENQQSLSDKANEYLILARLTATDFELPDRFEKAMKYFEQSLKAAPNNDNISDYAYFLQQHNQFNRSQELYKKALKNYRILAAINPSIYLPDVARTLNNLAVLYREKKELKLAEKAYLESLKIKKTLALVNPQKYRPNIALTLINLANLYTDKKDQNKAQKINNEALKIFRELEKTNPDFYIHYIASVLISRP